MMVHSSRRRRYGASIPLLLALLMLHAPHLFAAQRHRTKAKSSVSKKAAPPRAKKVSSRVKKATPAKLVHRLTKEEVEQAGLLAAERADREQAEKMDPSARQVQIEDRVHAWMRTHHRAAPETADDTGKPRTRTATKASSSRITTAASAGKKDTRTEEAKSSTPSHSSRKKATAADFDAAAAAQSHAPEPKPDAKPRSAVALPDEESGENDQVAEEGTPAKVTRAEAARVAKSPTPQVKLEAPEEESKPASAIAAVAASVRVKKKSLDPETAEKIVSKTFKKQQQNDDDDDDPQTAELDDDEVPTGMPASPALRHDTRGRLIVPAPMKGTREILIHQNVMADREGLDRIEDNDHLDRLRNAKLLVPIPANSALLVNRGLPANRRYTRPWTARFLADMASAHYSRFHSPIQVNSAVRTIEFQRRLIRVNGNAAPPTGETASPHLTGQAVDLAKRGMSLTEIAWMRGYLLPLVQEGKIDVEEEFQQACFHISVYKAYMPEAVHKRKITKHRSPRLLAAGVE
ncbi:MAG: hypothetical protein JSS87_09505 [Acidobacteria bacterium]|nr:hypothetical protein [Acidobacteriota bacterium]